MRELLSAVAGLSVVRGTARRARVRRAAWVVLAAAWPAQAAECGAALPSPPVLQWAAQGVTVAVAVRAGPFGAGRPLPLLVALCGRGDESLAGFDADMPAHRHGMNYRPSWKPDGPQTWAVDGVLLHMPGAWRLIVDVQRGGERLRLTHEVVVR